MIGTYFQTIIRNEDTGNTSFTVAAREECDGAVDGLINCLGIIPFLKRGTPIYMEGKFDNNMVFHVSSLRICCNQGKEMNMLLQFIVPGLKDVGNKSDFSLETLYDDYETIFEKFGLNQYESNIAINKIKHLMESERIYQYLSNFCIPHDMIADILKDNITLREIKNNPYHVFQYRNIPFKYADAIMNREWSFNPYIPLRIMAYVEQALYFNVKCGNTCITPKDLLNLTNALLKNNEFPIKINAALLNLCLTKMKGKKIVWYKDYIYRTKEWEAETNLIHHFFRLQKRMREFETPDIEKIERKLNISYTPEQRAVFQSLCRNGIKILTGPPGAGKTAVIQGLIDAFGGIVRLSATTGRASQVLAEYCGKPAETIHKMLDIRPFEQSISCKNINNPVEADLIIVDEFSMAGTELTSMLFQAVKSGTILLLVGDEDQLQSVEYGNVLHELIQSGLCEVYRLTEVFRHDGSILDNARLVNNQCDQLRLDECFHIEKFEHEDQLLKRLKENYRPGSQIISSIKSTDLGTIALNHMIQPQRGTALLSYGDNNFYKNDRVIFTVTDYAGGYFNGDIGIVIGKDDEKTLKIKVKDKEINLERGNLHNLALAYAITIHKCQGSSFDDIHIILPEKYKSMLTKRLLYTAITRGRKKVFIYYMNDSFTTAIHNIKDHQRISLLQNRLLHCS